MGTDARVRRRPLASVGSGSDPPPVTHAPTESRDGSSTTPQAPLPAASGRWSWLPLSGAVVAAVVLRTFALDRLPGLNGDEAGYGVHALMLFDGAPWLSLRTGTDLPMNLPYFGVVAMLHWLLEPSFFTLRLAALLHSLTAAVLAYVLFRKQDGERAAWFAALVAVLPIHVGYARFGWDPAAVPTVMLLALAAAVRQRPLLTALAFALCLTVHPMTAFALPILAAPLIARRLTHAEHGTLRAPSRRALALTLVGTLAAGLVSAWLVDHDALPTPVLAALRGKALGSALSRLLDPLQVLQFLGLYVDLLSGATLYRYITGALSPTAALAHAVLGPAIVGCVAAFSVRRLWRQQRYVELFVLAGIAVSLALAYAVAGPRVLRPRTERYGIFLTIPSCYVLAACLASLSSTAAHVVRTRIALGALGLVLVSAFCVNYVAALHVPEPQRENAFRTGETEPKAAALQDILRMRDPSRTTVVLAQDWWLYWPLRYLAHEVPNLRVTIPGRPWDRRFPKDYVLPALEVAKTEVFGVAWVNSPVDARMQRAALQTETIAGFEHEPILHVHRLPVR